MKYFFVLFFLIQSIALIPANAENKLTRSVNSLINSLPNFSQLPNVANRTINASIIEWNRLNSLVQLKFSNDTETFQKLVQNLTTELNTLTISNSFSLTTYKAYVDLGINYRNEFYKVIYTAINDVLVLITIEIPKSFRNIVLASKFKTLLLI